MLLLSGLKGRKSVEPLEGLASGTVGAVVVGYTSEVVGIAAVVAVGIAALAAVASKQVSCTIHLDSVQVSAQVDMSGLALVRFRFGISTCRSRFVP